MVENIVLQGINIYFRMIWVLKKPWWTALKDTTSNDPYRIEKITNERWKNWIKFELFNIILKTLYIYIRIIYYII